ncbi:hypothetical protein MKX07_004993 [Trichoderma sp. CBMAI-0711]|nr:hypothetical protein MKX07_004993 [Trichoderma sp. CBMAI-0711]
MYTEHERSHIPPEYEGSRAKNDDPLFAEAKYPSQTITKARVRDLTRQFAYFLRHQYGIGSDGPGRDVVVSISTGQSALGCVLYAVLAADGIYSAASPSSTVSDLTRQIKDGPGKVVVCSEDVKGVALSAARVLVSHQNMVSECYLPGTLGREAWERIGRDFPRSTLGHLPAAHIAGLQSYFVNAVYDGAVTYWMPSFNFDDFVRYFAELKLTFFFSVPPIFMAIAKHPAVKNQFKSVEYATSAAAPMSYELQQAASKKLKGVVYQVWGLSETTGAVTYTPPDRTDTMGSLSPLLPNVSLRLVDENDNDVEEGQSGEALLKGPMVTKGYHNNPDANKAAFTTDGWFRTGDVLKKEGDVFYLVDRKKELIKYKGLQVAPAELEGVLTAHPSVADAAVIGTKREDTEVPTAYVALASGAKGSVSEAELVDYVRSKVADYKRLRGGVIFIEAIPRSPTGKILRKDLRALHSRQRGAKI